MERNVMRIYYYDGPYPTSNKPIEELRKEIERLVAWEKTLTQEEIRAINDRTPGNEDL